MRRRNLLSSGTYDREIEYIEVNGTQYINTNIVVSLSTNVIIEYGISSTYNGHDIYLFGAIDPNGNGRICYEFITSTNTIRTRWGSSYATDSRRVYLDDKLTLTVPSGSGAWTLTNNTQGWVTSYEKHSNYPTNAPFFLGGISENGSPSSDITYARVRFYSVKIGGLDLIPVRKGNVGYLYDKNSGNLLGNSGSGNFILGQDK